MAEVCAAAASPYVVRIAGESNEERGFDSYMDARRVYTDYKWKLKAANAGRVELLEGDNIRENFDASISPDAGKKAKKRSAPGSKAVRSRKEQKKAVASSAGAKGGKTVLMLDGEKVKRAMTAFMFFSNDRRPELQQANPDMKITEISKLIGAEWKELSDEKKEPYTAKATADKARFEEQKARAEAVTEEPKQKRKH